LIPSPGVDGGKNAIRPGKPSETTGRGTRWRAAPCSSIREPGRSRRELLFFSARPHQHPQVEP
jgi:hypothetical protein